MKQRYLYALGLVVTLGLLVSSVPASAARRGAASPKAPDVSVLWTFGTNSPFGGTRFDGEYVASLNRVYFLGFRTFADATDGSVWYYDVATNTYVDTTVDMKVPVSNYKIAALTDSHGLGLYIFGGRDATPAIVTTVQAYYPSANKAITINTDPWPGQTPAGCVSLPAMGVDVIANKAYVVGGASFSINGCVDDNSAQTWVFDPAAPAGSKWTAGPSLHVARGYITTAVLQGRIYAIGGDTNSAGVLTANPTVEAWKPPLGGWNDAAVADLPVSPGCDESQAFAPANGPLKGGIVLANCGQWPAALPDTYFYKNNAWTNIGAINESRRNEAGALFKVGTRLRMYILGGYDCPGNTCLADPTTTSEFGTGAPIGSRPGFSRPAPHTGAKASTS
jgi:hypothetical protein